MKRRLTWLQKEICNELQRGLPVCTRPFEQIAARLCCDEQTLLANCRILKRRGVIRRIGAVVDHRRLGFASTLVAAHVPATRVTTVAGQINKLRGVSHNYLRAHYYNVWFTLQARSQRCLDSALSRLTAATGVVFHSLPVVQVFKLDVCFDAESGGRRLLKNDTRPPPEGLVRLSRIQRRLLTELAGGLEIESEPFAALRSVSGRMDRVLDEIKELEKLRVIRRIAAVMDHRKLGFSANALFVCAVRPAHIKRAGRALAKIENVSHCYQRKTFPGWPYNLFAMMHARTMQEIQRTAARFTQQHAIRSYELLATVRQLKKQPISLTQVHRS